MISSPRPEQAPVEPVLLTPDEAAAVMRISPRLLWKLTKDGELAAVRIGRLVRYRPADLHAWAETQATRGPGEYRRPDGAGRAPGTPNHKKAS